MMRKAREALKALPPEQREQLWYGGIGPGDSYIGMWRMVNAYRFRLNALFKDQTRADVPPVEERQLEKDIRYYSEQITSLYGKLLVHEKPKLASVEVKGDQQKPIYHEVDLKNLSDDDLAALARILPKLGAASQAGEPLAGAVDAGARRGAASARAGATSVRTRAIWQAN
jgi:hypothetical protein